MKKKKGKYNFPKIEKVIIRNFSLYTKSKELILVKEKMNNGVYCLAGANGLGKTTFLNIINYTLTGLVLEPQKEVFSPSEILKSNKKYTSRYFDGRIKPKDKKDAEVEIAFRINNKFYRIIRGFDEINSLRLLEIYSINNGKKKKLLSTDENSPKELHKKYEENLANDVGIGKYEYFVFLQLYVLTFDENRRMLFWDDRASTNTLSIAFNYDLDDTDRIIELKQEMDALESHGRNARWQATQIKKEQERLLVNKKEKELINWEKLKKEFDDLNIEVEENEKQFHNIEVEYDSLLKRQNIINSELLQLKTNYKKLHLQYFEPRSKLLNNELYSYSQKRGECFLCGASGNLVTDNIAKNLLKDKCPICDTVIVEGKSERQEKLFNKLKMVDKEIEKKNSELEELIFDAETKKVELDKAEFAYYSSKEELNNFEKEYSQISFEKTGDIPIDLLIEQYIERFNKEDKKSKDYYKKRDKLKPEYDNLIKKVNAAYKEAEEDFVPLFKRLAKSFIGLNLNVYFKKQGRNIVLNFELLGSPRTESHQLSESQRFFLDIALRMALTIYLSRPNNEATLLIDTPEGSLDIAYESRVGNMFADYILDFSQNIIMTANINASQLLIALAEKCGDSKMQFRRMLEWTDLTEIQKEGEHLFNKVYNNIEKTLKGI